MSIKYTLEKEGKHYRIIAARRIRDYVDVGVKGGLVTGEHNLSHHGNSWISYDSYALDHSRVSGNAYVFGKSFLMDNAVIRGRAMLYGASGMLDDALVCDRALIGQKSMVSQNAVVRGRAVVSNNVDISGNAMVYDKARIFGDIKTGGAKISDNVEISGSAAIRGLCFIQDKAKIAGNVEIAIHGAQICWNTNIDKGYIPYRIRSDGAVFCLLPQPAKRPMISTDAFLGTADQSRMFWKSKLSGQLQLEAETQDIISFLETAGEKLKFTQEVAA